MTTIEAASSPIPRHSQAMAGHAVRCRARIRGQRGPLAAGPALAYRPVQARSSRSRVSAMFSVQILPLSMPARSSSGAWEQS
jgi:hypothetical protein